MAAKRGRKPGSLVRGTCCVCKAVEMTRGTSHMYRCTSCRAAGQWTLSHSRSAWYGKEPAGGIINLRVRKGEIPPATSFQCTDCSRPACQYDHRDYNRPLMVDPVCRSCNLRRGPAIPVHGSFHRLVASGSIPYRRRSSVMRIFRTMGLPDDVLVPMPPRLSLDDWRVICAHMPVPEPATPAGA